MPTIAFCFGVLLVVAGAALAVVERLVQRSLRAKKSATVPEAHFRAFALERAARRLKIGLLILLLGAAVTAGESFVPRESPRAFLASWLIAALTSVALVRMAWRDFVALRRHWSGELRRSATEIERIQAELRGRRGPDAEPID